MRTNAMPLVTLTWLDRKRVWATPNRATSLGTTSIPVHPSLVGGQASRPSIAYRHFTPTYVWLMQSLSAVGVGCACLLALSQGFLRALSIGMEYLAVQLDKSLHTPSTAVQASPIAEAQLALAEGAALANNSVQTIHSLYSMLSALDVASAATPAPASLPAPDGQSWGPLTAPLVQGSLGLNPFLTAQAGAPLFRSYLGEWRRLSDQAGSLATLPISSAPAGSATATFNPKMRRLPAVALTSVNDAKANPQLAGGRTATAYGLYLTNAWVF